jgi:hypothetical protein
MNVDHITSSRLSRRWDLRLEPKNLQTAYASCNWAKGGQPSASLEKRDRRPYILYAEKR